MKKILLAFAKGIIIGLVLLPIEFSLLNAHYSKVKAFDPRDLRDEENRGCCTRNDGESTPEPSQPPSPTEPPEPTPEPTEPPGPGPSESPSPTECPECHDVGGVTTETITETVTEKEKTTEYIIVEKAPPIKALAPTSSK